MRIAAAGDNCIDYYDETGTCFCGGNSVNVAVYTVRLGNDASYIGAVGDDKFGTLMCDGLNQKSVDISHIKVLHGSTALTHVSLVNGDRVFTRYDEGVMGNFKLTEADIQFIHSHDLFVSGFWGRTINDLEQIKAGGILTAFDFATKLDDPTVIPACRFVDYPFFSYDEGRDEYIEDFMKQVSATGSKVVSVTMGVKGSLCYDGSEFYSFGLIPCRVVDTMGAGDSYISGFLKGVLERKAIPECMKMGAENAAVTLQYSGAW